MKSHVLSVGHCTGDDVRLGRLLAVEADAHLDRADTAEQAKALAAQKRYDLILVNRIVEHDGSSGVELIAELRRMENAGPMMLVSDYPDAQAEATAAGALQGFGKSALGTAEVGQMLRQVLHSASRAGQRA